MKFDRPHPRRMQLNSREPPHGFVDRHAVPSHPIASSPVLQTQPPPLQLERLGHDPLEHVTVKSDEPQMPQSVEHVLRVSRPLQMPSPHRGHAPQSLAHVPQLSVPLHVPSPQRGGVTHAPAEHVVPARQAQSDAQLAHVSPPVHTPSPHTAGQSAAQLAASSYGRRQRPSPHQEQLAPTQHRPATHDSPAAHTTPHDPHANGSDCRSRQLFKHTRVPATQSSAALSHAPAEHTHVPARHESVPSGPQRLPQRPQFNASVPVSSVQRPLQSNCPDGHVKPASAGGRVASIGGEVASGGSVTPPASGSVTPPTSAPASEPPHTQRVSPRPSGAHVWLPRRPSVQVHGWVAFGAQTGAGIPHAKSPVRVTRTTTHDNRQGLNIVPLGGYANMLARPAARRLVGVATGLAASHSPVVQPLPCTTGSRATLR